MGIGKRTIGLNLLLVNMWSVFHTSAPIPVFLHFLSAEPERDLR